MRDPLAELPGYALRRAANAMMAELSTRLAKIDLRISDASVLLILNGAESLTSSDIGRTLDSSAPTWSRCSTGSMPRD